jgi:hypothetical protein
MADFSGAGFETPLTTETEKPKGPNFSGAGFETPDLGEQVAEGVKSFGGGLVTGLRRDPLIRPIVEKLAEVGGLGPEQLDALEQRLSGSRISDVAEIVGEWAPMLAGGLGAYGVGRVGLRAGAAALGRTSLAKPGGQFARLAQRAEQLKLPAGSLKPAERLGRVGIERPVEIAGGALGLGTYSGAETYVETEDIPESLRAAATTAAIALAFEGAITGVGSRIAAARDVDVGKLYKNYQRTGRQGLEATQRIGKADVVKLNEKLRSIFGTDEVERGLTWASRSGARSSTPRMLTKSELSTVRKTQRELAQAKQAVKAGADSIKKDPFISFSRDIPFNPSSVRESIALVMLKAFTTPESYQGKLGVSFARFVQNWRAAENNSIMWTAGFESSIMKLRDEMGRALGLSRGMRQKNERYFDVFDAWESARVAGGGGEAGVRAYMQSIGREKHTNTAVGILSELDSVMFTQATRLFKMGAEHPYGAEELAQRGVAKYLPHYLEDLPEKDAVEALTHALGRAQAMDIFQASQRDGLSKLASFDFNRAIPLSIKEARRLRTLKDGRKVPGIPFMDPWNAIFRHLSESSRRLEYGSRFGYRGELAEPIIDAVVKEGGSRAIASTVVGHAIGHKVYDRGMRELSKIVLGGQTGSKLALAVIPNISQPILNPMAVGLRNTVKGLQKALHGENQDAILAAVALSHSIRGGVMRPFGEASMGPRLTGAARNMDDVVYAMGNVSDRFGSFVLKWSGFNLAERWNRLFSGGVGLATFRDTFAKASGINGTPLLRGRSLERARRQMQSIGIDLDDVVSRYRKGTLQMGSREWAELEKTATFGMAQWTQFIPSPLRRPLAWSSPWGRVMFQFKTFALGQGRFIRDAVFAEAARGNMKPMAYFLSIYPIAGELVGDVKALVKDKDRPDNMVSRLVNDYTQVGGMGIITDAFTAARFGRFGDWFFGPTAGDAFNLIENLSRADVEGLIRQVTRWPLYTAVERLMLLPVLTAAGASEYLDTISQQPLGEDLVDVNDLMFEATQNKRE